LHTSQDQQVNDCLSANYTTD